MSTNLAVKRNISGMQVIKTLQLLLEDNYTMTELIEKLNETEKEPIFNNSVVSKYINTCRYCGIEIPKIHNKYFLAKLPFGLDLSNSDIDLIEKLQVVAVENFTAKSNRELLKLVAKINKFSNKQILKVEKKTLVLIFEAFEKAIREKRHVLLMFKAKAVIECIPLAIIDKKGKKFFKVIHNGKERQVSIDRVSGLEISGKLVMSNLESEEKTAIFKLFGILAKNYTLREHEKIFSNNLPESITISNVGEDKEELLSRLLRYDSCCELISPQEYRDEMKLMINKMLENYGE